jgi:hypothetical protein
MGFTAFWGLWSIAYHEANLGNQDASVAYLTEYSTNSKIDLYQDCETNLNKNQRIGSYDVGTTVSQYSLDEPMSVYIVNSNASEDEVSIFIGPVKVSDGKCGYIAILGSYIIQKNKRDGQSTAALKDEIEHDILTTTSALTRQEVFQNKYKWILPACRYLYNKIDFISTGLVK